MGGVPVTRAMALRDQFQGLRMGHLGPDLLADDWTAPGRWQPSGRDEAVRRILAAMHDPRTITPDLAAAIAAADAAGLAMVFTGVRHFKH